MELSISAVTDSRKFSKSLVRHSSKLSELEQMALDVDTSELAFDTLQLLFLDRGDEYMRAAGCRHANRLFQVEVPAPNPANVDFTDETEFVTYVAKKLRQAVTVCGLPSDKQMQLIENIDSFIASLS
jgi:hypothetical protein